MLIFVSIEATLLVLNAMCVLHEERFLAKFGWSAQHNRYFHSGSLFSINQYSKTLIKYLIINIEAALLLEYILKVVLRPAPKKTIALHL